MNINNIKDIKSVQIKNKKITSSENNVYVFEDDELIERIEPNEKDQFIHGLINELVQSEPYVVVISYKVEVDHANKI